MTNSNLQEQLAKEDVTKATGCAYIILYVAISLLMVIGGFYYVYINVEKAQFIMLLAILLSQIAKEIK